MLRKGVENMQEFFVQNIQGVLFIENFAFRNKLAIAARINNSVNDLFDGDPIMLELPLEAPPEIPRMQLKDSKGIHSLNFSPNRLDFFYKESEKPAKTLDSLSEHFLEYLFNIVDLVKGDYHLTISRVGVVLRVVSEVEEGSNPFIYQKFLGKNSFFRDCSILEIHALENTTIGDYDVNRWFRIRTNAGSSVNEKTVSVEIDINSRAEKLMDFQLESTKSFFKKSFDYARASLLNCFGESL
jgi:hypothetical protein